VLTVRIGGDYMRTGIQMHDLVKAGLERATFSKIYSMVNDMNTLYAFCTVKIFAIFVATAVIDDHDPIITLLRAQLLQKHDQSFIRFIGWDQNHNHRNWLLYPSIGMHLCTSYL